MWYFGHSNIVYSMKLLNQDLLHSILHITRFRWIQKGVYLYISSLSSENYTQGFMIKLPCIRHAYTLLKDQTITGLRMESVLIQILMNLTNLFHSKLKLKILILLCITWNTSNYMNLNLNIMRRILNKV